MIRLLALFVCIAFLGGCSGDSTTKQGTPKNQKPALADLGNYLKVIAAEQKAPPAKAADLDAVEPRMPEAYTAVKTGIVVYVWGVPYQSGSSAVLAYEKDVETTGGWVLLQDGTLREMSAADFKAATKAKK